MNNIEYKIYQVKKEKCRQFGFVGIDELKKLQGTNEPQKENYNLVYTGELKSSTIPLRTLGELFQKFNIDRPKDFISRSMSVSDIVTLNKNGVITAWYCDSIGWKEVQFKGKKEFKC